MELGTVRVCGRRAPAPLWVSGQGPFQCKKGTIRKAGSHKQEHPETQTRQTNLRDKDWEQTLSVTNVWAAQKGQVNRKLAANEGAALRAQGAHRCGNVQTDEGNCREKVRSRQKRI